MNKLELKVKYKDSEYETIIKFSDEDLDNALVSAIAQARNAILE